MSEDLSEWEKTAKSTLLSALVISAIGLVMVVLSVILDADTKVDGIVVLIAGVLLF